MIGDCQLPLDKYIYSQILKMQDVDALVQVLNIFIPVIRQEVLNLNAVITPVPR